MHFHLEKTAVCDEQHDRRLTVCACLLMIVIRGLDCCGLTLDCCC